VQQLPSYSTNLYGQVAFAPPEGTAEGVVQFVGSLRIQQPSPERFHVRQPVRMQLAEGRIVDIDRSTAEGAYLDDWFKSFDREDAYEFAHVNLGLTPLSIKNIDNESIHFAYGGVLIGFGIRGTPVFGTPLSDIPNHVDIHMTNASYYVDGVPVLKDGKFSSESGLTHDPDELI
jgi:leucyl aminopeptidase (aminopeptidase T)